MEKNMFVASVDFDKVFSFTDLEESYLIFIPIKNIKFIGTEEDNKFLQKVVETFNRRMTQQLDRLLASYTEKEVDAMIEHGNAPQNIWNLVFEVSKDNPDKVIDSGYELSSYDHNQEDGEECEFRVSEPLQQEIVTKANDIMLNLIFGGKDGLLYRYEYYTYGGFLFTDSHLGYDDIGGEERIRSMSHVIYWHGGKEMFTGLANYFLKLIKPLYKNE